MSKAGDLARQLARELDSQDDARRALERDVEELKEAGGATPPLNPPPPLPPAEPPAPTGEPSPVEPIPEGWRRVFELNPAVLGDVDDDWPGSIQEGENDGVTIVRPPGEKPYIEFRLRPGDRLRGGKDSRSEINCGEGGFALPTRKRYHGVYMLEAGRWFSGSKKGTVLSQAHSGGEVISGGVKLTSPVFGLRVLEVPDDPMALGPLVGVTRETTDQKAFDVGEPFRLPLDREFNVDFDIRWTNNPDGFMACAVDGEQIATYVGATYLGKRGPGWKVGVYRTGAITRLYALTIDEVVT